MLSSVINIPNNDNDIIMPKKKVLSIIKKPYELEVEEKKIIFKNKNNDTLEVVIILFINL